MADKYIIHVYEKSTVRLTSLGLAQARPNEIFHFTVYVGLA